MSEQTEELSEVEQYIHAKAVSYSSLSRLSKSPKAYLNKTSPTGDALDNGSAVDILLTESEKSFHSQFYVMTESKPSSEMMLAYVMSMLETNGDMDVAQTASGYKKRVSEDKWKKEGMPYYDAVKASKGKTVLSFEQYQSINSVVNQIRENKFVGKYFNKRTPKHIDLMYQFIHYFDYEGTPCKIKLDILLINHKSKVIEPLDLKTTGKPIGAFKSSYRSFNYSLQGGLYKEGVMQWRDENYPDYAVLNFGFIVAEMAAYNEPVIYKMSHEEHICAEFGGVTPSGYEVKGFKELLEDLEYHKSTDLWDYPREIEENNGVVQLETMIHK